MSIPVVAKLSFKVRYAIFSSVVSVALIGAVCITYTNYVDGKREASERRSDQQWCELVTFYDDYYTKNPPTTELQRMQAALMHARRISLGCPITNK